MRFYAWMMDEHKDEFDKAEETHENPLGLVPNAKATAESIRDYYNYTVIVSNYKPMGFDEIEEGLRFNKKRLAQKMVEAFKASECYKAKSEKEREEIIRYMEEETMEETPGVLI